MPNYHKHWYGTLAQYNALATKDSNTLYHCSEGLIYRGSVLLATRRWGDLSGVPSTFAPSAHTHDDRYALLAGSATQNFSAKNLTLAGTITGASTIEAHSYILNRASYAIPKNSPGWYRIATYQPAGGDQTMNGVLLVNTKYNAAYPEAYKVLVSGIYNTPRVTILESNVYGAINRVTKFRVTTYQVGTYSFSYAVDVYWSYDGAANQTLQVASIGTLTSQTPVAYTTFDTDGHSQSVEIDVIPNVSSFVGGISATSFTENGTHLADKYAAKAQTMYIGTTAVNINRTSGALALTGISSLNVNGSRSSVINSSTSVSKIGGADVSLHINALNSTPWGVWMQVLNTANSTYPMLLNPIGGNVGIGTLTPGTTLDVAGAGNFSTKVITGGYNYTAQTAGVGIGADGALNGVTFYNGTGVSGRIYRDGDVMHFNRGGDTSKGFELSAAGVLTHRNNFTVTGTTSLQDFTATSGSVTSFYASSSVRVYGHETSRIILGDSLDGILILCPLGMGSANNVAGTIYITRTTGAFMTTRLDFGYSTGSSTALYNAYLEYTKGSYSPSDVWELVSFSYSGQDWVGLRRTSSNQYFYTSAHFSGENLYDGPNSLTWINSTSATGITTLNYSTSRKVFTQAVTMDSSLTVLGSASFQSVSATTFSGPLTGNASSATILQTARKINGVDFNGSANITITANTTYTLTRGSYLTGSNFNGSANTTWAVDATSANTAGKVVARDSNGDFSCRIINAVTGVYSLKVVTGGHNYASQTYGVGIGTDGSNSGVIFYNGTGATGRIYRESDVMRFIRGGLTYSGFDINADGSITVQGDMTTRTSLVVGSTNGTYVQIGSARLVYDQTNNAIKVVNADNSSCSLYATGSISAFGIGSSGGSGGSYSRLDDWGDYVDGLTNDYVLSAELGYDLHTRVNSLNSFRSGTSWGSTASGYIYLSIGGTSRAISTHGHVHSFASLSNKPTTLGGFGITDAMSSSGGTFYGSSFQILEIKRNGTYGASMMFSNNNQVLAKFGFDPSSSLVIATGDSPDAIPNMLYINGSTKQITGYGSLNVSGNIETGTSDGAYILSGLVKFLYDNSVTGIRLLKNAGGYAPFYAGSVYANEVQLTSSRSMKKDIMPFKNGLDLIKSINVVSYLYKQDSDDDDRKIGFIADDTDSWLSGKSKTKYNIGNTVGALIKAVQELEKKNQELEQRLLSITNNN